jgi:glycosyltransferase involved in cell wall biosynthesis
MAVRRVAPTLQDRFLGERHLAQIADEHSRILCFGNLPPLFRCRGRVSVLLHNRHLVSATDLSGFRLRTRLRLRVERLWIRTWASHAREWIVQTDSMRRLLKRAIGSEAAIRVLPFVPPDMLSTVAPTGDAKSLSFEPTDFCYVSSGEPHKNHRNLVEAWVLLAAEGIYPSLRITLDECDTPKLCGWISRRIRQVGLQIENVGRVPPAQIGGVYRSSKCLIHPSWCEAFPLPLLEAKSLGLPIVAAELDHVRDLVAPEETFDPHSPKSIARAVRRHLGRRDASPALLDGKSFLQQLSAA